MKPMQEVENAIITDEKSSDNRIYELGYLLVPTIPTDDVSVVYGNLKELVTSSHGEIIADETPRMIQLAYTMRKVISNISNKFNTAYFGWTKFAMDGNEVVELKKKLDLDSNIIRFLILKTVRENTIAQRRFVRPELSHRRPSSKKSPSDEAAVPMDKAEIDKEIDALISV